MSEDGILVRKTTIYTNYAINCLIIEHNFTFLTVRVSYLFWSTQNTTDDSIDGDDVDAAADDDVEDQLKENHYKYIICTLNIHKTIGLENV